MSAMSPRLIFEAVKRWMWRELKVLELYSLWRSLGGTIWLVVSGLLILGMVKYFAETPPESFFIPVVPAPQTTILAPIMDIPFLQRSSTTFFRELPYVGPLWEHLPLFNHREPLTYLAWGSLFPFGWLGTHLLRRKVKENPLASSITVHGDVGMMNTGTMAVRHIESIAAHLNRISSPTEKRVVDAITEVTKAVTRDSTLNAATRAEVLDLLIELAQQAASPPADRSRGVGRAIVRTLDVALNAGGNLADIWSTWGQPIKAFFGFSG
jgi:hypothetical protein